MEADAPLGNSYFYRLAGIAARARGLAIRGRSVDENSQEAQFYICKLGRSEQHNLADRLISEGKALRVRNTGIPGGDAKLLPFNITRSSSMVDGDFIRHCKDKRASYPDLAWVGKYDIARETQLANWPTGVGFNIGLASLKLVKYDDTVAFDASQGVSKAFTFEKGGNARRYVLSAFVQRRQIRPELSGAIRSRIGETELVAIPKELYDKHVSDLKLDDRASLANFQRALTAEMGVYRFTSILLTDAHCNGDHTQLLEFTRPSPKLTKNRRVHWPGDENAIEIVIA